MNRIDPKLAATLRQPAELVARGLAPAAALAELEKVAARYAIAVTPDIAALIKPDDPSDPIARQFVPSADELIAAPGESADPIGDDTHSPVPGIVHRYPDRVLLKPLHACPVYCRFCFRREQVGPEGEVLTRAELDAALEIGDACRVAEMAASRSGGVQDVDAQRIETELLDQDERFVRRADRLLVLAGDHLDAGQAGQSQSARR